MARAKFAVGEQVEVFCYHLRDGALARDWLPGTVVQVDNRMAAVRFDTSVYSNNGYFIPDRTLWLAHGSPRARRPREETDRS